MATERRLAAIMFTDIVGYTALMAESEVKGHRVRVRQGQVLRPLVERYGGDWVQHVGDETLSSFQSATDAVNCALAIQAALQEEPELRVRVGIHLGEIVSREGSVHGDGVNIASRVRPLAEPGGICISDEVRNAVRNQENIETVALGAQELKNVGRAVSVFVVSGTAGKPPGRTSEPLADRRATTPSLAVLPLDNLGSPEQEYVADGVTDALIESLARVGPELRVISRTSVMQYKGTTKPAREIADELGVTLLIEGTAQRQDNRVLIRVQLIEARDDAHLWAHSYERDLRDFFSLQREIARMVAGEIEIALKPERESLLAATRPVDPKALDLYLRAVALRGPHTLVASWGLPAIELLERSVALDPDLAEAWVELAWAHDKLGEFGLGAGSRDDFARAQEAAQRAVELDEHLSGAQATLGLVRLFQDWDFSGARSALERAVELSPSDPHSLNGLARYLRIVGLGKSPDAELVLEQLLRVAPLDLHFRRDRMAHYLYTREYERGIAEAERIREFAPEFADIDVAWNYMLLGRPEDAAREMLAWLTRGGAAMDPFREAFQRGSDEGGWLGGMRAWRDRAIEAATQGAFGLACVISALSAVIGETEEAMTWLERGYEARDPILLLAKTAPFIDPLRSDPRFQDLLRRIGFPES